MIDPDHESIDPDPSTVKGILQRLENALKQVVAIIGIRWETYVTCHPFLVSYLEDIQRVRGTQLARRCDQKLGYWDGLARRAENLAFFEPYNEVTRLVGEARVRIMRERADRARLIKEQEEAATVLREWQHRVQRAMDTYTPTASQKGPTLESLRRESIEVRRAYSKTMRTLDELRLKEEASVAALSDEERLEKEAEAQAQANWTKELADVRAELRSFTVLDCAE